MEYVDLYGMARTIVNNLIGLGLMEISTTSVYDEVVNQIVVDMKHYLEETA